MLEIVNDKETMHMLRAHLSDDVMEGVRRLACDSLGVADSSHSLPDRLAKLFKFLVVENKLFEVVAAD